VDTHEARIVARDRTRRHFAFARLLSSAVLSQAALSATSFIIGAILIRSTTDLQYGYYVLAANALLLLVSLQNAIFKPPLAIRWNGLDRRQRGELVGGLYREQRRLLPAFCGIAAGIALLLWYGHVLDGYTGSLVIATAVAALAILRREYFRMVLLAYRRPHDVLRTDMYYVGMMVTGVLVAISTPAPALVAVIALGLGAAVSSTLLAQTLKRTEPWSVPSRPGLLRDIAPLAVWSTAGAAVHWIFSQGYIYLVAGTLDVAAVAAIAATRLLLMPANLLSTGIGSLMLPLASGWLQQHGVGPLLRRLCLFAAGLAAATLCYAAAVWLLRDWIFADVLKKQFGQRDALLALWSAVFLVVVIRDQLLYLPAAQGSFRVLTALTLASAVVSLAAGYLAMLRFGTAGALMGLLVGEMISLTGVVVIAVGAFRLQQSRPA
jgi:O-antigen/teichoic acid export membrane protein